MFYPPPKDIVLGYTIGPCLHTPNFRDNVGRYFLPRSVASGPASFGDIGSASLPRGADYDGAAAAAGNVWYDRGLSVNFLPLCFCIFSLDGKIVFIKYKMICPKNEAVANLHLR